MSLKVTIITTCKNSESTIEDTIRSVLSQDHKNIEYIIVDGGSTDGTLNIIEKFKHKISKIIKEKDEGFYFAINKGIGEASGDVIGNLNSDDFYSDNTIISKVVKAFESEKAEGVYGDLHYVDKDNTSKIIRNWKSGKYEEGMFVKGWMPPHPTFFVLKKCYEKFGSFNTAFKSAADYEIMLRFIHKHKIKVAYIPEVLIKMRVGGKSNVTMKNRIMANLEDRKAWEINGLKPELFTLIKKPLSKLQQYLR